MSAAIAAMGAGLGAMVAKLTLGVRKFEAVDTKMRKLILPLHQAAHALIPMIDADTHAFNDYVAALGLPKDTEADRAYRAKQLQLGLKKAIDTPLSVMTTADAAWEALVEVAKHGNIASKSDVEVGAKALETGIWGAYKNVIINMTDITDDTYKKRDPGKGGCIKGAGCKYVPAGAGNPLFPFIKQNPGRQRNRPAAGRPGRGRTVAGPDFSGGLRPSVSNTFFPAGCRISYGEFNLTGVPSVSFSPGR